MIVSYDFRALLKKEFARKVKVNARYSSRSFAAFLGMDSSTYSKLIHGKRPMGAALIRRLGKKLGLGEEEIAKYVQASAHRKALNTEDSARFAQGTYQLIDAETFEKISHWYDYAILELTGLKSFRPTVAWISNALNLDHATVESSIRNLRECGLLSESTDGQWTQSGKKTTTDPADPKTANLRNRLMKDLIRKSLTSFEDFPKDLRTSSAGTLAIDRRKLPEAIEKIRAFRADLSKFFIENGEHNDVYSLLVSLVPLTQLGKMPGEAEV